jgi:hypothetical protein
MRLAVIGTPRSGNTWLRLMLAGAYGCESLASHRVDEVPWLALPGDVVVQLHQPADSDVGALLEEHGFRVVALARHPLDVLLSILHFASHDPSPARWLEGAGDELAIAGASPLDAAFLDYATGPRATALLAISRDWWTRDGALRLRYEDLHRDAAAELGRLTEAIGAPARRELAAVVAANSLERLRPSSTNHHFWLGRPGHWRRILTGSPARKIEAAQPESFTLFDYVCDPDPELDPVTAQANWLRIARPADRVPRARHEAIRLADSNEIRNLRAQRLDLLQRREQVELALRAQEQELAAVKAESEAIRWTHDEARAEADWRAEVGRGLEEELEWRRFLADEDRRAIADLESQNARLAAEAAATRAAYSGLESSRSVRHARRLRSLLHLTRLAPAEADVVSPQSLPARAPRSP